MYIVWDNNILRARADARPVHAAHTTSIAGTYNRCRNRIDSNQCAKTKRQLERNFTISRTKEYQKAEASPCVRGPRITRTWVNNAKGIDHDQFQTCQCGCYSVSGDRNPRVCTRSCPGTWLAGFLPEPWCRIPVERDGKRYGLDTQRLKRERAAEAHFREALHQRPQDVTGSRRQVGAPIRSIVGPMDRLCYQTGCGVLRSIRGPGQCAPQKTAIFPAAYRWIGKESICQRRTRSFASRPTKLIVIFAPIAA